MFKPLLKNEILSVVNDIYSFLMLSICAIYRPWVDLYQSLKHKTNDAFLFHRKTYHNFLTKNLRKMEPCLRLYWYLLYGSNFIIAKLINIILFYPFRFYAITHQIDSKNKAYKRIADISDIDESILKQPAIENKNAVKLLPINQLTRTIINGKELYKTVDSAVENNVKQPISRSKMALNQFRINPY